MDKLNGKVAFITGGARGQGRAHAVTMAREGANIAVLDICKNLSYPRYSLATKADLDETVKQVQALGRKALGIVADVRSASEMEAAVKQTVEEFGHIDILVCNAGIADMGATWDLTEEWWDIMLDINLKGYWLAAKYVVPQMLAQKTGGRIIMTSSVAGLKGMPGIAHYCASKWGVVGLAKSLGLEVAEFGITVNTIHPTGVDTPMIAGMAEAAGITKEQFLESMAVDNMLPVSLVESEDIANAALWLASEDARYVTGQELKVDAGLMLK
jgi:SDR family mycofactocin-dependent oxidoreductase